MRAPLVLIGVLLVVILVDDDLVLLVVLLVLLLIEIVVDLLLLDVETNLLGLLRRKIRLTKIHHLLERLWSDAATASNQPRVDGLPGAQILRRAATIGQHLLVSLSIELIKRELMLFFDVVLLIVFIDILAVAAIVLITVLIIVLLDLVTVVLVTSEPSSVPGVDPGLLLVRVNMVFVLVFFVLVR